MTSNEFQLFRDGGEARPPVIDTGGGLLAAAAVLIRKVLGPDDSRI